MQRLDRALDVALTDHARDADGGRGDHLDVHVLGRQRLEHLRGNTGVGAHPRADQRHAADAVVVVGAARLDLDDHLVDDVHRAGKLVLRDGERDVGATFGRHVLLDHVDVDVVVGQRAEQLGRDTRTVGHVEDRDLGLGDVVGDARDDRLFHVRLLVGDPRALLPREARAHVHRHLVVTRELDRPHREHAAAGGRHLEHLVVGDPRQLARLGHDRAGRRCRRRRRRCRSRTPRRRAWSRARPR